MSLTVSILSPHIDDASYGLTLTIDRLLSKQIAVKLINCFTVTKWTAVPVVSKEIQEVSRMRAAEDADFNALFNSAIEIINLGLLDAPLRNDYILRVQPLSEDELNLAEDLKNKLEPLAGDILLCPLGIGNHIDHAICLEAVVQLYPKQKIIFFEDLPYSARISHAEIIDHIKALQNRLGIDLGNHVTSFKDCSVDKESAIRVYKSQINDEICQEIITHMRALKGERLWGEAEILEVLKKKLEC